MTNDKKANVKFNLFTFNFTPYVKNNLSPSKILTSCIQRINDERTERHKAIVVDRAKGRKNEFPRNLFVSSAAYKHGDNVYKCRIALIRDNKIPMIVNKDNYMLKSFDKLENT